MKSRFMNKNLCKIVFFLITLCAFAAILWLHPKGMAELTGAKLEEVTKWELTQDFEGTSSAAHSKTEQERLLYELYQFRFHRPMHCAVLTCNCESYDLSLIWNDNDTLDGSLFILLEDGVLWDGTWCYSLVGGEEARTNLTQWLQSALGQNAQ